MRSRQAGEEYPPEGEAQRRFEALIRAARRPPIPRKDVPRKEEPSPSEGREGR